MKKILGLFAICLSFSAFAGNNDIYITQTGTGLTLTIDQIGATDKVALELDVPTVLVAPIWSIVKVSPVPV